MIPDYTDRWVVSIGTYYIAGLGKTFEGQHDGEPVPVIPGIVITRLQYHAMKFSNLSEAASLAKTVGGQVFKVPETKRTDPAGTGYGPRQNNPQPFYQKGGQDANGRPDSSGRIYDWRHEGWPVNAWPETPADARKPDPD